MSGAGGRHRAARQGEDLVDGAYVATAKEKTMLSALLNGHGQVWPQAEMVVSGKTARFFKSGKQVWECNAAYAQLHFKTVAAEPGH